MNNSSTLPFKIPLDSFERCLKNIISDSGTLNIYAQVSPCTTEEGKRSPPGMVRKEVAKPKFTAAARPKSAASGGAGKKPQPKPEMTKRQRFAINSVVAIRNEDGGVWLGRLLRPLNLGTDENTKVQWFEEVKSRGKGKKFTLTQSKDNIATQSIHPMEFEFVQEEGGLWSPANPGLLQQVQHMYQHMPM